MVVNLITCTIQVMLMKLKDLATIFKYIADTGRDKEKVATDRGFKVE